MKAYFVVIQVLELRRPMPRITFHIAAESRVEAGRLAIEVATEQLGVEVEPRHVRTVMRDAEMDEHVRGKEAGFAFVICMGEKYELGESVWAEVVAGTKNDHPYHADTSGWIVGAHSDGILAVRLEATQLCGCGKRSCTSCLRAGDVGCFGWAMVERRRTTIHGRTDRHALKGEG